MGGRRKSRSRSQRRRQPSASNSSEEASASAANGGDELTAEGKLVLMEVEVATLKAENRELRKKLVEALRRGTSSSAATSGRRPALDSQRNAQEIPEDLSHRRRAKPADSQGNTKDEIPEDLSHRRRAKPTDSQVDAKEEIADDLSHRRRAKQVDSQGDAKKDIQDDLSHRRRAKANQKQDSQGDAEDGARMDEAHRRNAVMLANSFGEIYNEEIPANIVMEKKGPIVNNKLDRFLDHFDKQVKIIDLKSGGAIIKDKKTFTMRYSCVFRESGSKLKCTVNKRFFYGTPGVTYVLDFETHASLVTATPGTRPDGSLGVREPRTENLIVLYEERRGKITNMWVMQDTEKLGLDPKAREKELGEHSIIALFEKKLSEQPDVKGKPERIFHNYHDTETIGA